MELLSEVRTHCAHQRPLHTPIVVHCSSGVGRTGAFCLLYVATREVDAGQGLPDLPTLLRRMRMQRKYMLQEKLQLRLCYEVLCEHVAHVLQEHGAPPGTREPPPGRLATPSAVPPTKGHSWQDLQDIVLGGDLSFSSIKATVARLSVKTPSASLPSDDVSQAAKLKPPSTDDDCFSTENVGDADFEELPSLPDPQDTKLALVTLDEPKRSEIVLSSSNGTSVPDANPTPSPDFAPQMTGEASTSNEQNASLPPGSSDHKSPRPQEGPLGLDLLASLTPETFTLGGGRSKITKQSFLQPQPHGLATHPDNDDPLSDLDPLWSQHK
uniref:tyrosine-protein phosphatase non-receptor type 23-like n=1 Tax=Myxine glutinosa TaxID=7769 RepID=UPI00358E6A5C